MAYYGMTRSFTGPCFEPRADVFDQFQKARDHMNLQGDFEGLFLTSILQLLCNDQKTGLLRVTSGKSESRVYFEEGTIIYASGSQKEARLGYILRRDGIISAEQLQKCLELTRDKKLSLGKILVDKGYVSLDTLKKFNTKQVEEILYNLLLWKKGKFEYKDAKLNLAGMVVTQLNPMKLILEASRRIDELSILSKVISNDRLVFKMSAKVQNKEEIKLNANEWRILSLIDGSRTVRQIIGESGYDEFAVYKILYSVISYGLIEKSEEVHLGEEGGEGDYSAVMTVYNDILQSVRKHIREELGDRAHSLFDEVKEGLDPEAAGILGKYHPANNGDQNIRSVLEAMEEIGDPEEGRERLIAAFNGYCTLVLKKVAEILGVQPIQKVLEEMEKVIGFVKKYQAGSSEKNKIVNDVKNIIMEIESELGDKGKSGKSKGIFSLFS